MQPRIPNQFYNRPSLPLGETGACEKESQRTAQVRSNLTESTIKFHVCNGFYTDVVATMIFPINKLEDIIWLCAACTEFIGVFVTKRLTHDQL